MSYHTGIDMKIHFKLIREFLKRKLLGPIVFKTSRPDGPFRVGVKVDLVSTGSRQMRVLTWYPAISAAEAAAHKFENGLIGTAVLDAPPDDSWAPYPLIVYSPGLLAPADASVFYTENLASHGYVVMSPDHMDAGVRGLPFKDGGWKYVLRFFPRILWAIINRNSSDSVLILHGAHFKRTEFGLKYRPAEISRVLDLAGELNSAADSPVSGLIDCENVGLTGHSLGGFTSLLFGGMSLIPGGSNDEMLDLYRGCIADVDVCRTRSVHAMGDPFALKDERVKAVLAMAPPIFHGDIAHNASAIRIPLMLLAGDSARWEATLDKMVAVYAHARGPKHLVLIRDTDHFVICDYLLAIPLVRHIPLPMFRKHFPEKATVYKDYSSAFFNLYLKGNSGNSSILEQSTDPYVVDVRHSAEADD